MKILNQQILKDFWKRHPDSEHAIKAWFYEVKKENWSRDEDILKAFSGAKLFQEGIISFELVPRQYYLTVAFKASTQTFFIKYVASFYETGQKNFSSPTFSLINN
jgi:mRNA interferase HigB